MTPQLSTTRVLPPNPAKSKIMHLMVPTDSRRGETKVLFTQARRVSFMLTKNSFCSHWEKRGDTKAGCIFAAKKGWDASSVFAVPSTGIISLAQQRDISCFLQHSRSECFMRCSTLIHCVCSSRLVGISNWITRGIDAGAHGSLHKDWIKPGSPRTNRLLPRF